MSKESSLSDNAKKIINASSISGQRQLMKYGEFLMKKKQLEQNTKDKEESVDNYVSENIIIKLPFGLEDDNYSNAIRNLIELNKDEILKRYEKDSIAFGNELLKSVQSKNELFLNDFIHIYYGNLLLKDRLEKVNAELGKEKEENKSLQELYNETSAESIQFEENIDNLEISIYRYKLSVYVLLFLNFFSTLILGRYLFLGPDSLYNDTMYVIDTILYLGLVVIYFFDNMFNYAFHMPNSIKFLFFMKGLISYYLFKNKEYGKMVLTEIKNKVNYFASSICKARYGDFFARLKEKMTKPKEE